MKTTIHTINLEDYKHFSKIEICRRIDEGRQQYRYLLGRKWTVEGEERETIVKELHEIDLQEDILQIVLEAMDMGEI